LFVRIICMKNNLGLDEILLALAHELGLLLGGLEATMTELGRSIDELEGDLLSGVTAGLSQESLTESQNSLARTDASTLDHDPVVADGTVVREATHRGNLLLGEIELGGGKAISNNVALVILDNSSLSGELRSSHLVDLLVDLGTVVVTVLTSTGNRVLDSGRMPGTNTGDLAETLVRLSGQFGGSPTGSHTLETLTLGHTNDVDHLILGEHLGDGNGLFEETNTEVDLSSSVTTVDLDLHEVSLLLGKRKLLNVGVSKNTDDLAVLLHLGKLTVAVGVGLTTSVVLGESLLLGAVPVLVEATEHLLLKMGSPDGGQSTETRGSLDVTNHADNNDVGALDNGHGLDTFLLVHLGSRLVDITDDVSHTGLVTEESG